VRKPTHSRSGKGAGACGRADTIAQPLSRSTVVRGDLRPAGRCRTPERLGSPPPGNDGEVPRRSRSERADDHWCPQRITPFVIRGCNKKIGDFLKSRRRGDSGPCERPTPLCGATAFIACGCCGRRAGSPCWGGQNARPILLASAPPGRIPFVEANPSSRHSRPSWVVEELLLEARERGSIPLLASREALSTERGFRCKFPLS